MRHFVISVLLLSAAAFAGCLGNESAIPGNPPGTLPAASVPLRSDAVESFTITGQVLDATDSSKVLIQTNAAENNCGKLYVTIAPSTTIVPAGAQPQKGEFLGSVGSGSCLTSAVANKLYLASTMAALTSLMSASPDPSSLQAAAPTPVATAVPHPPFSTPQAGMADSVADAVAVGADNNMGAAGEIAAIKSIGFRHLRTNGAVANAGQSAFATTFLPYKGSGIKMMLLTWDNNPNCYPGPPAVAATNVEAIHALFVANGMSGYDEAYEAPNEENDDGCPDANWLTDLPSTQTQIWDGVKTFGRNSTVIGPSAGLFLFFSNFVGSGIDHYMNYWAVHDYGATPGSAVSYNIGNLYSYFPLMRPWTTEAGWQSSGTNSNVDQTTQMKYSLRLILEHLMWGDPRTYFYTIADTASPCTGNGDCYGLTTMSYGFKPVATGLKNLIAVFSDPGATFTPKTMTGATFNTFGDTNIHFSTFQRHNGSWLIPFYQEVTSYDTSAQAPIAVAPQPFTVTFGGVARTANLIVWNSDGTTTTTNYGSVTSLSLQATDSLSVLQVSN